MRAWRKWLKSQRKHDKDSWAADIGVCRGRAAYARRHRGTNAGQGIPDVVPTVSATPFTARSLVGMSGSAKKRLREAIFCGAQVPSFAIGAVSITAALRIGERLRPCHGCTACNNTMSCCGCRHGYEPWDNRYAHHICDPEGPCDGSGVLPATKAKRPDQKNHKKHL